MSATPSLQNLVNILMREFSWSGPCKSSCLRTGCCKGRYNRRLHVLDRVSWDGTRKNVGGTTLYQALASVCCLGHDLRVDVLISSA